MCGKLRFLHFSPDRALEVGFIGEFFSNRVIHIITS